MTEINVAHAQSIAHYLGQLLMDRKQIEAFPNTFVHVERLIDEEITKVWASLFKVVKKNSLVLAEPKGLLITITEKVLIKDHLEVSMMVNQIENTLLINEFDVYKHLMVQTEDDWEWLRKFFNNHILKNFEKEKYITHKVNNLNVIQQKSLNSKLLLYSKADLSNSTNNNQLRITILPDLPTLSVPPLPEPSPEEEFPDDSKTHQLLNQKVLWNFEDLRMLLGTDLPIFGGDTYPCLSLRNMSKPINVLTGIDYWLDNLMCYVPEVVMCYHLKGFVQKYELVNTEDLPHLNNSKFSPKIIRDVAQHILSFLKSNTTKAGHTYWLFKGKNDDVVKLYDLTSLCSESLVEEHCEGKNPFTIPVAMLLYRIARNLKHNLDNGRLSSLVTIRILLNNCLKLLNKTKYPQVVTSVNYLLSDLYIPVNTNPISPKLEYLTNVSQDYDPSLCYSDDDSSSCSNEENPTFSVDIHDLCLPHKKTEKLKKSKCPPEPPSEPVVMTLEERCKNALFHVGCGLNCLQYFKDLNSQLTGEEKKIEMEDVPRMASFEAIPMSSFISETNQNIKKKEKINNKNVKNKNRKRAKGNNIVVENDNDAANVASILHYKSIAETMPTWHNPPDALDSVSWKLHIRVLLYEKACLSYTALAEHEFTNGKYGKALKHFRSVFECCLWIINTNVNDLFGFLLARCGNCCKLIAQNWDKTQQYTNELESDEEYDFGIREALLGKSNSCALDDFNLIPSHLNSKEDILNAAVNCYERSLFLETNDKNKNNLNTQICNIYNKIIEVYIKEIATALQDEIELTPSRLQRLITQSKHYFTMGIDKFKSIDDLIMQLALLCSNMGQLYRFLSYYSLLFITSYGTLLKDFIYQAVECYTKGLAILGNRRFNPELWDIVCWDLSTILYDLAIRQYKEDLSVISDRAETEKEVISLLLKALKYCDLENNSPKLLLYEFRAAHIYDRLASLYHYRLRFLEVDVPKFKTTLHQCVSHYNRAYELFFKIERPLECISVLIKTIELDELQLDIATNVQLRMKFVMSIVETLGKCVELLKMLLPESNNSDIFNDKHPVNNDKLKRPDHNIKDQMYCEEEKQTMFVRLEERLQHILKCMIKLAFREMSKLTNKINQLKIIYEELLRKSNVDHDYSYLLRVVTQISELSL